MGDRTAILLHGAGFGPWIWDRVIEQMTSPALALAVPGREPGATPDGCATRLAADIDAAGIEDVVLVVHSLSGVLVPGIAERLGSRLRHVLYVSAVIPEAGTAFVNAIGFPAGLVLRGGQRAHLHLGRGVHAIAQGGEMERVVAAGSGMARPPLERTWRSLEIASR